MRAFKYVQVLGLSLVMLLSAACFNVTEEFIFRKDGSGSARVVVDMSQMMELLKAFSGMDGANENGEDPMASMNEAFEDMESIETLKGVAGISNVVSLNDKERGIIGYSFDFKDIDALNRAISENATPGGLTASMGLGDSESGPVNQFLRNGKKFSRTHPIDGAVAEKEKEEEDEESAEMMKMMFKDASYTVKYTFEDGVKKAKGNHTSLSADKKTVTTEVGMLDLMNGDAKLTTSFKTR